jgi:hypothetical protein
MLPISFSEKYLLTNLAVRFTLPFTITQLVGLCKEKTMPVMDITLNIELTGSVSAVFTGPGSDRVTDLFGTNRIPTPFTFVGVPNVEHHAAYIITRIRAKNPGSLVTWSTDRCEQFVAFTYGKAGR